MDAQPPAKPLSVLNRLLASRPLAGLLALDWSQSNRRIGAILGVSIADAWRLRHRLREQGHPIPVARRGGSPRRAAHQAQPEAPTAGRAPRTMAGRILAERPIGDLLALDWSRTNHAIASALGIADPRAGDLRRLLREAGHQVPAARRGRRRGVALALDRYRAAAIGERPDAAVAQDVGVSKHAVCVVRLRHGIPRRRPRGGAGRVASGGASPAVPTGAEDHVLASPARSS